MTKQELFEQLEQQLKAHDWYYQYSDDHRYYTKGRDESSAISRTIGQLTDLGAGEEARTMLKNLSPEGFYND